MCKMRDGNKTYMLEWRNLYRYKMPYIRKVLLSDRFLAGNRIQLTGL